MKRRPCAIAPCPERARKMACFCSPAPELCEVHQIEHACPATPDPKAWRKANAHENDLTGDLIDALNRESDLSVSRVDSGGSRRGGRRLEEPGIGDIVGLAAPLGIHIELETKKSHTAGCKPSCKPCAAQKVRAAKVARMGGVYVGNVRSVADGLAGVRVGLAEAKLRLTSSSRLDLTDSNSTEKTKNQSGASDGLSRDQGPASQTNQKVCRIS